MHRAELPADRERHRYIHSIRENYGIWGVKFAPQVARFADKIGVKSVLDYGCGKALLAQWMAEHRPDIEVINFDPGIPERDMTPEPADLVVCTDVIPLVGELYLAPLLDDLDRCARKAMFLVLPLYAPERVPDYHSDIILWSREAWIDLLTQRWPGGEVSTSPVGGNRLQYVWTR